MKNVAITVGTAALMCGVVAIASGWRDQGPMPDLGGAVAWVNSSRLSSKSLRGKVVLVNFWTYSCIYSLRELPHLRAWADKYRDAGLVVVGVHTPEFSFEKNEANVNRAIRDYAVNFPVAVDTDYAIWRGFNNRYWPANYIIDAKGRIRFSFFGEGGYNQLERVIRELLRENGATSLGDEAVAVAASAVEVPGSREVQSPETYVGYQRAEGLLASSRVAKDRPHLYSLPKPPELNQWGLRGVWNIGEDRGVLVKESGQIEFRFRGRDLHMVLAPAAEGLPVRFKVTLDGAEPAAHHGADTTPDGSGTIREPRLYQLIRQKDRVTERTFTIEFLDPGVQAFTFTFG